MGPRGRAEALVATKKHRELTTVAETSSPHTKVLHQTKVLDLVTNYTLVDDICEGGREGGRGRKERERERGRRVREEGGGKESIPNNH